MQLQQKVRFYLDDMETKVGQIINFAIASLILLSAIIFVVETYPISDNLRASLRIVDWFILFTFTVEYLVRLGCAEQKFSHLISGYSLVDLIAILPFLLGFLDVRFIRLLRWLRILRLVRFMEKLTLFGRLTTNESLIFVQIIFTLFAIIFIYSGLIYQVEHPNNPEQFKTFLDAVYFVVVTMTTVGFGDVTPTSEGGRWLTVMMILTGIALIPRQLGNLIQQFVKDQRPALIACSRCGLTTHDADALFCKRCGTGLQNPQEGYNMPSTDGD
ncbi:MAG: potassium channel family protein [Pseudanabaenales cyanobacterium]|nr:potassium channel family protein [Pseudanabaenales cyanobacterium]